jgi:hypothetical protein
MSNGTDPTPIQLTPRFALDGSTNYTRLMSQLVEAGTNWRIRDLFTEEILRLKKEQEAKGPVSQIDMINGAAEVIGAEVHWIN